MFIKKHQRGGSIIAILIVVGILAWLGIKIFPLYSEKSKMVMSVESVAAQPDVAKKGNRELQTMLLTRLGINDVSYINSANFNDLVKIEKVSGGFTMTVKYYRTAKLVGDFYLLLEAEHTIEVTE
jgi:ABC-type Na+ efflux pump permease subunit